MTIRLSAALLAASALACASVSSADTLLYKNINGYSLNGDRELIRFSALQIEDDRVVKLYLDGEPLPNESALDRVLDGDGKTLTTGLIDAHGHVLSYGQSLLRVDLVGTTTEAGAADRVRAFAADKPELDWVLGRGWNQVLLGQQLISNSNESRRRARRQTRLAFTSRRSCWMGELTCDGNCGRYTQ